MATVVRTANRQSGDASFLRRLNEVAILGSLREVGAGASTVAELARASNISRATAEGILEVLVADGWAEEVTAGAPEGQRGRPARRFAFRAAAGHVAGVGIGGSSLRAMVADLTGRVVARVERRLPADLPSPERLAAVADIIEQAAGEAGFGADALTAVGIGTTGVIDGEGRIVKSVVLEDWTGVPLQAEMSERLPVPVLVENDMRLAVLSEHWVGVARGRQDVMYLHLSNRIGLGLLFGGVPYRGSHAAAGELGGPSNSRWRAYHHVMEYAMAADPGELRAPSKAALFAMDRARGGDEKAAAAFDAFATALAEGLVALVTPLDPELVVVGGSLARAGDLLAEPIRRYLGGVSIRPPEVLASSLGTDAICLGAVRYALDHAERLLFSV